MRKFITILIFVVIVTSKAIGQPEKITYLSPGIGFSWNFNGEYTISPKLSLGNAKGLAFNNITLEFRRVFTSQKDDELSLNIEYQQGKRDKLLILNSGTSLITGSGYGISIPLHGIEYLPSIRVSVFAGYIIFIKSTIMISNKVQGDVGLEGALPIFNLISVLGENTKDNE
jgi:hypothetical protein